MKNLSLLFFFFAFFHLITAQTYSIDQYAARYERRPLLEIRPNFSYGGFFISNQDNTQNNVSGSLDVSWREELNQDDKIQSFQVNLDGWFNRAYFENEQQLDRFSNNVQLGSSVERFNYSSRNRFLGFRNDFSINISHQNNNLNEKVTNTSLYLAPGIFAGSGRIEYAEDAILANWMMDDLLETGTISSATPEQREQLARRITAIIGNRTFDIRKRRVYELEQLQLLFEEQKIAVENDFSLFAILNDNWAFARRAVLPHGKRWKYGLDGTLSLGYYDFLQLNNNTSVTSVGPYVEREAAFIKNNNSSHVFRTRVGGYLRDVIGEEDFFSADEEYSYGAVFNLTYQFVWLPISRSRLVWNNNFVGNLRRIKRAMNTREEFESTYSFRTMLNFDYFISPQWSLQLTAGVNVGENLPFDNNIVRPHLGLSSLYFLF